MTSYRVGRDLGRTIYRMTGEEPSKRDELIGLMDTRELGALVVEALNLVPEYRALFDLQHKRMAEATALWRAEDPEKRELVMPDLGALLTWLMERAR
jgi:hypothetical protein